MISPSSHTGPGGRARARRAHCGMGGGSFQRGAAAGRNPIQRSATTLFRGALGARRRHSRALRPFPRGGVRGHYVRSGGLPQFDCHRFDLSEPCKQAFNEARSIDSDALLWLALASRFFCGCSCPTWRSRRAFSIASATRRTISRCFHSRVRFARCAVDLEIEAGQDLTQSCAPSWPLWRGLGSLRSFAERQVSVRRSLSLRQRLTDLLNRLQGLARVLWPRKSRLKALAARGLRPAEEIEFSSSRIAWKFGATRAMAFAQLRPISASHAAHRAGLAAGRGD